MALHCSGSCSTLFCNVIQFLAFAFVFHTCQALTGNWQLASGSNIWTSGVPPNGNFPSSSALPLILDATARISVAPATALGTNSPNYVTFGAGEAIMIPLCAPSFSTYSDRDTSQDSKISFDPSSTLAVSLLNASTGNLTLVIPTQSIGTNTRVLNGFLKVSFPTDVYATGCMMIFTLTKLKFAPDIICVGSGNVQSYLFASRAGSDTFMNTMNGGNPYPLINDQSRGKYPFVAMATFSDTRPSRPTRIRITSQNSLMRGSFSCTESNPTLFIQLPLYFGNQFNTSALTANVFGSMEAKVTTFVLNPFSVSGKITISSAFLPCGALTISDNFFVEIVGLSTPAIPSTDNTQAVMSLAGLNLPVVYPSIETISNARISFGSVTAAGAAQFIVSFVTSFDVVDICGPGDSSNMKQRIVIRIHDAAQMTQMCNSAAQPTARFLSVPKNSPVRIGKVALSLVSSVCEISLYLSSGDIVNTCVTSKTLPAPEQTSEPIELAIDGLKLPDGQQPPMAVSFVIDEASPKGITQSCSKCAEWPATPVFSGSIELATSSSGYYVGNQFPLLVATLNDIGGILPDDTVTIQIPRGISYSYYSSTPSSSSPVVCIVSTSADKFDVKSYYPFLVMQWKTGNAALPSASIKITCSWATNSGGGSGYWISTFDAAASADLLMKKESGSSVRQIRTGYSPARFLQPALSATLLDQRPGLTTTFSIQATRGSFTSTVIIPALGFSLIPASNGAAATALCACRPGTSGASSNSLQICSSSQADQTADIQVAGEFLKIFNFGNARFNYCNMTVRNPNAVGPQGSSVAYIDSIADRSYSAPSISGISSVSVKLSEYTLATTIQATITFAHTTPVSPPSEVRLSGFCNFGKQSDLSVIFSSGSIQATASLSTNGCDLVIAITSGTLAPPPTSSVVRCIVSNLRTPAARQARAMVGVSTYSSSSSVIAIDSCSECAFVSEMPLFVAAVSLSSTSPGAASVEISIYMKNTWDPFVKGSTIDLAIPGDWQGPSSGFKMSVNGDMCDASVFFSTNNNLQITYAGASTYTSLDITINLGPYYTVPRKLLKPFSFTVTKSSSAIASAAVSSPALYPEISGSCPAGHFLNSTSNLCNRCNDFRYNDGSMSECQICTGQGLGELSLKATKCVSFCTWPFEYMYDLNYAGTGCMRDGGLCSNSISATEDVECPCNSIYYSPYGPNTGSGSVKQSYSSSCTFVNLNANVPVVATVFVVFITIFIACVFKLPSKPDSGLKQRLRLKANLTFLALFPTLDFLSDMVYILTSKFNNIGVFLASVFFFVFPM